LRFGVPRATGVRLWAVGTGNNMHNHSRAGMGRLVAGLVLGLLLFGVSCAPKAPPATAPRPGVPAAAAPAPLTAPVPAPAAAAPASRAADPIDALRAEFTGIFDAPTFGRLQWSVVVQSLATGEVVYGENPSKLMMPASNMKIVTLATAAERLGWDFVYETKLVTAAPVAGGVLNGDLVVVGSGDPTIGGRGGSATRVFEGWADQLRADGITEVKGRIVADARAFDRESLGAGWAWDYLASGYAAGVSALQFNESVADVAIHPGPSVGTPAVIEVRPIESGLILEKRVTTVAAGEADLDFSRLPGSNRLIVRGTIPVTSKEIVRAATVDRPALYFARMLRATLIARGIRVSGDAGEFDDVYPAPPIAPTRVLLSHRSAPLAEFAKVLMKASQNQYAETLVRTLGAQSGPGTAAAGQKIGREVLDGWGVPQDAYVLGDGSGLSRYDYVCAEMLVNILRQMYRDPRHRDPFMATLPVGGQDGTIARRFVGTRAAKNVRAKTGSIANVRALSGYVTTLDGEPFVFSILANNFTVPQATIDVATDLALERLANFTRHSAAKNPAHEFNH
jgi:serine-type D-Ala-D-Ala carboxypeptidase/endopeptidase (penicillin-binding protein 4)